MLFLPKEVSAKNSAISFELHHYRNMKNKSVSKPSENQFWRNKRIDLFWAFQR